MEQKRNPNKIKNGGTGTRVGKFLRSVDFKEVVSVLGNMATGNVQGAIDIISGDTSMSEEEREFALTVMRLDIAEMEGVSERWKSDMSSDSILSKNVRPLSLIFLTVTTVILIYIDSFSVDVVVPGEWIELLKSLLLGIYIAYFGSRGLEKYKSIK
tara:strand:+ start:150 stop:617 length:468 start_codon:yes stop_codon:yes gene_type:complete